MQEMTREVWSLTQKLLHKHIKDGNTAALEQVRQNLWYAVPVVYSDWERKMRTYSAEWERQRKRRGRWLHYVEDMSATFNQLYLVSLTFDDICMSNTTAETRQKYVRRWLNANTSDYFACADYGRENGREHYHAIVSFSQYVGGYLCPLFDLDAIKVRRSNFYRVPEDRAWAYGFYSIRAIKNDKANRRKSAFYALKSASYAFKSADDKGAAKPFHAKGVEHVAPLTTADFDS